MTTVQQIYVNPDLTEAQKWAAIRHHRNWLLDQSDWSQLIDSPLQPGQRPAWVSYRQALRDIPETYPNPDDVVFPDAPMV